MYLHLFAQFLIYYHQWSSSWWCEWCPHPQSAFRNLLLKLLYGEYLQCGPHGAKSEDICRKKNLLINHNSLKIVIVAFLKPNLCPIPASLTYHEREVKREHEQSHQVSHGDGFSCLDLVLLANRSVRMLICSDSHSRICCCFYTMRSKPYVPPIKLNLLHRKVDWHQEQYKCSNNCSNCYCCCDFEIVCCE